MSEQLLIVGALAAGGAVYFTIEWIGALLDRRSLTYLERTALEVDAVSDRSGRPGVRGRLVAAASQAGWNGDLSVPLAAVTFLYLLCAAALRLAGLDVFAATAVALPVAAAAVRQFGRTLHTRRQRTFNHQLVQALELLAGQMEAGNGVQRSLEMLVPTMSDPLRSEFEGALEATVASKDLVEALRDIQVRYPSRALKLFIAALDIERNTAGQLGRPVREAANLLRGEFELTAELKAETAQQKMAAWVMVLGITGISGALLLGLDRSAFATPLGVVALSVAAANFAFGIFRIVSMIRAIEGGE
jgi:Flp pilus assembly protein TadB